MFCDYKFKKRVNKLNDDEEDDEVQRKALGCSKKVRVLRLVAGLCGPGMWFRCDWYVKILPNRTRELGY